MKYAQAKEIIKDHEMTVISWICSRCHKYNGHSLVGQCEYCGDYRAPKKAPYGYVRSPTGIAQRTDIEMNEITMDESIERMSASKKESELKKYREELKNMKPRRDRIEI